MAILGRISRALMPHKVPPVPATPRYELSEQTLIGCGADRECHQHPQYADRCIKVPRDPHPDFQQQNLVEWYCATALERRGVSFDHCAVCFGWVATNHGPGLVMERIRNDDGQPSPTLAQYVAGCQPDWARIDAMLAELQAWALANGVPVVELRMDNVLIREYKGQPHFVLIDGIGGRKIKLKFIFYRRIAWFGRMRAKHRWPEQEQALRAQLDPHSR